MLKSLFTPIVMLALLLSGCSKDDIDYIDDSLNPDYDAVLSSPTAGYNVLIFNLDKLLGEEFDAEDLERAIKIPVADNFEVELSSMSYISGDVIKTISAETRSHFAEENDFFNGDSDFSKCMHFDISTLLNDQVTYPIELVASLNYKNPTTKYSGSSDIVLIIRKPSAYSTTKSDGDGSSELVVDKTTLPSSYYAVGSGMSIVGEFGVNNRLAQILDIDEVYNNIEVYSLNSAHDYDVCGETYEETVSEYTEQFGISGSKPFSIGEGNDKKNFAFSASFDQSHSESLNTKMNYEFNLCFYIKKMMRIAFTGNSSDVDDESGVDIYDLFLDEDFNDVMNNPGSKNYARYEDDKDGIYSLYDDYGTHLITVGTFGGVHRYLYGRKMNYYSHSVSNSCYAAMSVKNTDSVNNSNWMSSYLSMMKNTFATYIGYDNYNSDTEEVEGAISIIEAYGGNASATGTIDDWDASIVAAESNNYVLIGYDENSGDGSLVDISLLCRDSSSKRYESLVEYYEDYVVDRSGMYVDLTPKMVLADVRMEKSDNGHKGSYDQKIMTGPDGVKRLYTSMILNANASNTKLGDDFVEYVLETSQNPYIKVADGIDQLWWYAYDANTECSGIKSIRFGENSSGYSRSGDCASDDMNWTAIDDNYVQIQYFDALDVSDYASTEDYQSALDARAYVTGFGLVQGDKENDINSADLNANMIFSTTAGGAEMTKPFSIDTNFSKYWKDPVSFDKDSKSWWGDNAATKMYIYPVYTTVNLPALEDFKNLEIYKPLGWSQDDDDE